MRRGTEKFVKRVASDNRKIKGVGDGDKVNVEWFVLVSRKREEEDEAIFSCV